MSSQIEGELVLVLLVHSVSVFSPALVPTGCKTHKSVRLLRSMGTLCTNEAFHLQLQILDLTFYFYVWLSDIMIVSSEIFVMEECVEVSRALIDVMKYISSHVE